MHNLVEVLSSPFVDEQGGQAVNDWYIGDFRRQFIWTEIWPVQTFLQRADSEANFDRDVSVPWIARGLDQGDGIVRQGNGSLALEVLVHVDRVVVVGVGVATDG